MSRHCSVVLALVGLAALSNPALAAWSYGVSGTVGNGIYVVDYAAATATPYFPTPGTAWYGATDGDTPTTFWATPSGGSLYVINVADKTATPVGSYGGPVIAGLAYNEETGVLYGTDDTSLYTIDKATGTANLIGAFGGGLHQMWALDYDPLIHKLVGVNTGGFVAKMWFVDANSGAATFVGDTYAGRVTDLWYDAGSGTMYGVRNFPGNLFKFNMATGEATFLGSVGESANMLGLGAPIPEPATRALLGLGVLAVRRR